MSRGRGGLHVSRGRGGEGGTSQQVGRAVHAGGEHGGWYTRNVGRSTDENSPQMTDATKPYRSRVLGPLPLLALVPHETADVSGALPY